MVNFSSSVPLKINWRKLHGTSGRYGNVKLTEREQIPFISAVGRLFGKSITRERTKYSHEIGSRRVVITPTSGAGYYGSNQFRNDVVSGISLHEGKIIYFEIVGWVSGDSRVHERRFDRDAVLRRRRAGV